MLLKSSKERISFKHLESEYSSGYIHLISVTKESALPTDIYIQKGDEQSLFSLGLLDENVLRVNLLFSIKEELTLINELNSTLIISYRVLDGVKAEKRQDDPSKKNIFRALVNSRKKLDEEMGKEGETESITQYFRKLTKKAGKIKKMMKKNNKKANRN